MIESMNYLERVMEKFNTLFNSEQTVEKFPLKLECNGLTVGAFTSTAEGWHKLIHECLKRMQWDEPPLLVVSEFNSDENPRASMPDGKWYVIDEWSSESDTIGFLQSLFDCRIEIVGLE